MSSRFGNITLAFIGAASLLLSNCASRQPQIEPLAVVASERVVEPAPQAAVVPAPQVIEPAPLSPEQQECLVLVAIADEKDQLTLAYLSVKSEQEALKHIATVKQQTNQRGITLAATYMCDEEPGRPAAIPAPFQPRNQPLPGRGS